jgi:FHA domain
MRGAGHHACEDSGVKKVAVDAPLTATSISAETVWGARMMQGDAGDSFATVRDRVLLDHGLTVGRQAIPGQVVLDHPNVSRRHAAFEIMDGTVVLRDLGGTNGTYVNGERLRGARRLVQGDRIDIGPFQLTFDGTSLTKVGRIGNVELLVRGVSYDVSADRPAEYQDVFCTAPTCVSSRPNLSPSSVPTAQASPR